MCNPLLNAPLRERLKYRKPTLSSSKWDQWDFNIEPIAFKLCHYRMSVETEVYLQIKSANVMTNVLLILSPAYLGLFIQP